MKGSRWPFGLGLKDMFVRQIDGAIPLGSPEPIIHIEF